MKEECEKCGYLLRNHKVGAEKCPEITITDMGEKSKQCQYKEKYGVHFKICSYCGIDE